MVNVKVLEFQSFFYFLLHFNSVYHANKIFEMIEVS